MRAPTSRKNKIIPNKLKLPSNDEKAFSAAALRVASVAMNTPRPPIRPPNQSKTTGSCRRSRCMKATLSKPTNDDTVVASKIGKNTSVGSGAPCCARYIKMLTGSMVSDEAFSTRNRICALVAVCGLGFRLCSSRMARRPIGVAALSKPKPLAAKFKVMRPKAGCPLGTSGIKRLNRGASNLPKASINPAFSAIFRKPNHKVRVPNSKSMSCTDSSAMSNRLCTMRAKTSESPNHSHWNMPETAAITKKANQRILSMEQRRKENQS